MLSIPAKFAETPVSIYGQDGTSLTTGKATILLFNDDFVLIEDHNATKLIPWVSIRSIEIPKELKK